MVITLTILSLGLIVLMIGLIIFLPVNEKLKLISVKATRGGDHVVTFERRGHVVSARGSGSIYRWVRHGRFTEIGGEVPYHILRWIWKQVTLERWSADKP